MPQSRDAVRQMFMTDKDDGRAKAEKVITDNGGTVLNNGHIAYAGTDNAVLTAIEFLVDEWDYAIQRRDPDNRPARIDSRPETYKHIQKVQQYIGAFVMEMILRGQRHDQSKLVEPELALFDEWTPRLSGLTFGSPEYKAALDALKPALTHHYANNSHHPEHYPNGILGMTLMDVVEMFCDWKAASERHNDGNILSSIIKQQERYRFSDELKQILINTIPLFDRAAKL